MPLSAYFPDAPAEESVARNVVPPEPTPPPPVPFPSVRVQKLPWEGKRRSASFFEALAKMADGSSAPERPLTSDLCVTWYSPGPGVASTFLSARETALDPKPAEV